MVTQELARQQNAFDRPEGGLFLCPEFSIPSSALVHVEKLEEYQQDSILARKEWQELTEDDLHKYNDAFSLLTSKAKVPDEVKRTVAKFESLQGRMSAYANASSFLRQVGEGLVNNMVSIVGVGRYEIGENTYAIGPGAWFRDWLHRYDFETQRMVVYCRNDNVQEPCMRMAVVQDHAVLIKDILQEQFDSKGFVSLPPK